MALKVTLKPKLPSNKAQTLGDKSGSSSIGDPGTFGPLDPAPRPFIDKLSVVLDPASDEHGHDIYNEFFNSLEDKKLFADAGSKAKWGPYKVAKRAVLPSVPDPKKWPLIQLAYAGKVVTNIRVEFVPVDLGSQGMFELHVALQAITEDGWADFVKLGRITRIDIAVDLPDIKVGDFGLLPAQGASTRSWSIGGELQTFLHGKNAGNQTLIYDRGAKRKAKGQSAEGKVGTRVERRIRKPAHNKVADLPTFPNPFATMNLIGWPPPPAATVEAKPYIWQLFRHATIATNLDAALALLPVEKRTAYRAYLKAHGKAWWDPLAIWAKWPDMLTELGIVSKPGWW